MNFTEWINGIFSQASKATPPPSPAPGVRGVSPSSVPISIPRAVGAPAVIPSGGVAGVGFATPLAPAPSAAPIVGVTAGAIDSVWPPAIGNVAGNSLGFLNALPRQPANAIMLPLGGACYALTLDPAWTAPNAQIGVVLHQGGNSRGASLVMQPGDTIQVGGVDRVWIYNADNLDLYDVAQANWPLGYCRFLAARVQGIMPFLGGRVPLGQASLIIAGVFIPGATFPLFSPGKIRAIRLSGVFANAGGVSAQGAGHMKMLHASASVQGAGGGFAATPPTETPDTVMMSNGWVAGSRRAFAPLTSLAGSLDVSAFSFMMPVHNGGRPIRLSFDALNSWGNTPADRIVLGVEGLASMVAATDEIEESILYDVTTGAGLANSTGALNTEGYEVVTFAYAGGVAASQLTVSELNDDGTTLAATSVGLPAGIIGAAEWGRGTGSVGGASVAEAIARPVPRHLSGTIPAQAAQTIRLIVKGYRREQRG